MHTRITIRISISALAARVYGVAGKEVGEYNYLKKNKKNRYKQVCAKTCVRERNSVFIRPPGMGGR